MKKVIILGMLLLMGCSNNYVENKIEGKWNVTRFFAYTPEVSLELVNGAKEMALSTSYKFAKNKTVVVISDILPVTQYGTYEILEDKTIAITYNVAGFGVTEEYHIESFKRKSMRWNHKIRGIGYVLMTLEKEK